MCKSKYIHFVILMIFLCHFKVCIREILPGDQVTVSYGDAYWVGQGLTPVNMPEKLSDIVVLHTDDAV